MSELDDQWLLRAEAAAYSRLSVSSLAHMACNGSGPQYYKAGNRRAIASLILIRGRARSRANPSLRSFKNMWPRGGGMRGIRRSFKRTM